MISLWERFIYPDLSYLINGILFKVHNDLGRFRNEKEYGDYIENNFKKLNIKFEREKILPISFEGEKIGRNKVDFLIEDSIILEIKVKRIIEKEDYYQIKRYLVTLNRKLGLLVNFRDKYLKIKRILNSQF
ncbi:MAG: GxxExxY protein [Microgenomates group bacterium]|nr:GxxExxY protein [Microgenomates group bacterium]